MTLRRYNAKRDFSCTSEPKGELGTAPGRRFVVQQHAARRMHFDVRLELDGVLKSWAVPKGPSLRVDVQRLAVQVEDHPVAYATFEGTIPAGAYGGGKVIVWDEGTWTPLGDARADLARGHLRFALAGHKLRGAWSLVRTGGSDATGWLLRKGDDAFAATAGDITQDAPKSIISGRTVHEVDGPPTSRQSAQPAATQATAATSAPARSGAAATKRTATRRSTRSAVSAPLPRSFAPQLATLVREVPRDEGWSFEVKLDGYRAILSRGGDDARVHTRNGHDWTAHFPTLVAAAADLPATRVVLDGEVVALDANGGSDFAALQRMLAAGADDSLVYCAFDLLWLDDEDMRARPQAERKRVLRTLLGNVSPTGPLRYWAHVDGAAAGRRALAAAAVHDLEGVVGKRNDAPYVAGRSRAWVKLKCVRRQEFVVLGYVGARPQAPRSLLLGVYEGSRLRYVGRVASGLGACVVRPLAGALAAPAERGAAVLDGPLQGTQMHWVRPEAVVEVRFAGWTDEGRLRHAVLVGARADRPASEVVRERAQALPDATPPAPRRPARRPVTLTHPERTVVPGSKVTKRQLADYLVAAAPYLLPWVGRRPLSVLHCPNGELDRAFFHRHLEATSPGLQAVAMNDGGGDYVCVTHAAGLLALVQASAVELHPWGARAADVEAVDTLVFDLDPGPQVDAPAVVQAAREVRELLASLDLRSLLKATGGVGLHVVVPGITNCTWPAAKAFAQLVADYLVAQAPKRYTATVRKAARRGKIFVDYLRNARGSTAIGVYSPRARVGLPVARPVAWDELDAAALRRPWDVPRLHRALQGNYVDPWAHARRWRQTLPSLGWDAAE